MFIGCPGGSSSSNAVGMKGALSPYPVLRLSLCFTALSALSLAPSVHLVGSDATEHFRREAATDSSLHPPLNSEQCPVWETVGDSM